MTTQPPTDPGRFSSTRTLTQLPTEQLEAIIDHAHTHLTTAPPAVADQLRATAVALRAAHTRAGAALTHDDHATAAVATAEAGRLARQLDGLENAQTRRDHWDHAAARLETQAGAAQTVLDTRHTADQTRPYVRVDTATLVTRLRSAQRRAKQAAATAERYDHQATQTAAALVALDTQIDHTATFRPAETRARQTVLAEQHAAVRIATIRTALDGTRLGHHTLRGNQRDRLTGELRHLQTEHPALASGAAPAGRWETLLAAAQAADRDTLAHLRADRRQATTDLDWYQGTASHLRTDTNRHEEIVTAIRAEFTGRTSAPYHPSSPRPGAPHPAAQAGVSPSAQTQEQIANTPKPPHDALWP